MEAFLCLDVVNDLSAACTRGELTEIDIEDRDDFNFDANVLYRITIRLPDFFKIVASVSKAGRGRA